MIATILKLSIINSIIYCFILRCGWVKEKTNYDHNLLNVKALISVSNVSYLNFYHLKYTLCNKIIENILVPYQMPTIISRNVKSTLSQGSQFHAAILGLTTKSQYVFSNS